MKIAIVADSTCDLPPDVRRAHAIELVPLHVIWGKTVYTDGIDLSQETFYERLASDPVLPTTSQPSPGEYVAKFREVMNAQQADGVICLPISNRLSGSFTSARTASEMVDFPVEVIDTRTGSIAAGFAALAAAEARDSGANLRDAAQAARQAAQRVQMLFSPNTLEFLHRGGRVSGMQRLIGTALSIKPILYVTEDGTVEAKENVRTRKRVLQRLVEIATLYADRRPLRVGLVHTGATDLADFRAMVQDALQPEQLLESLACPTVGVHVGPGAIGLGLMHGEAVENDALALPVEFAGVR